MALGLTLDSVSLFCQVGSDAVAQVTLQLHAAVADGAAAAAGALQVLQ